MDVNLIWLTVLSLSQAVLIAIRMIERANHKKNMMKNNPNDDPPCQEHGERLARLEASLQAIEKRLERLEQKFNGLK